jgi:hypothetical protein
MASDPWNELQDSRARARQLRVANSMDARTELNQLLSVRTLGHRPKVAFGAALPDN